MTTWFSASDLLELNLPEIASTLSHISEFITRVRHDMPTLTRPRIGRGGGYEVHRDALPQAAQDELKRRANVSALAEAQAQHEVDMIDKDQRQLAVSNFKNLNARQNRVMEARQTILLYLVAQATITNSGKDRVIRQFLADAASRSLDATLTYAVNAANDRISQGIQSELSIRTIYRWFTARDSGGLIALAPKSTKEIQNLPVWFDAFLKVYARPTKPSVAEALREFIQHSPMQFASGKVPTESKIRGYLAKIPMLAQLNKREGKLAMRARLAYVSRDFSDILPTSIYVGDGKTFDAEIAHPIHGRPFRPEITTIIDVSTRRVVGWSAALDENTIGVVDALRRASQISGIPAIFYTDNGPGYKNKAMDAPLVGFMARCGITPMRALPYNSQAKGVVERLNQVYTATAKAMPTYIGKDMDKEAKMLAFKTTRAEIKQTGISTLLPSFSSFIDHVEHSLQAYNARFHSSLPEIHDEQLGRFRHMSPNELWLEKCKDLEVIKPSEDELNDMFRPHVVRRTTRALVSWLDNSYFAIELEAYHGQDVIVGYDIHDASKVWVRSIELVNETQVPGKLLAVAIFEGHKTRYVPLTYEQAALEKRNKAALGRLQQKMDVKKLELGQNALIDMTTWQSQRDEAYLPKTPDVPAAPVKFTALGADLPKSFKNKSLKLEAASEGKPLELTSDAALVPEAPETTDMPETTDAPLMNVTVIGTGRPVFRDDVVYVQWMLANPHLVQDFDIDNARDLVNQHTMSELLRMSGVDVESLRNFIRSALETRSTQIQTGS